MLHVRVKAPIPRVKFPFLSKDQQVERGAKQTNTGSTAYLAFSFCPCSTSSF